MENKKNVNKLEGCERCKKAMHYFTEDYKEIIKRLGSNTKRQAYLSQCKICDTYWEEEQKLSYPISESDARRWYQNAFN